MTAEPITFTGTLTLQDALDLNHYHWRTMLRRPFRWLIAGFSLLIASVCLWAASQTGFHFSMVLILALCLYFPFGWLLERRLTVVYRYKRHPEHYIENTVSFTPDSIALSNRNMDLRLAWNQLRAIITTPRGILFLLPPHNPLFWLPNRLFVDNEFRSQIMDLALTHSVNVQEMA